MELWRCKLVNSLWTALRKNNTGIKWEGYLWNELYALLSGEDSVIAQSAVCGWEWCNIALCQWILEDKCISWPAALSSRFAQYFYIPQTSYLKKWLRLRVSHQETFQRPFKVISMTCMLPVWCQSSSNVKKGMFEMWSHVQDISKHVMAICKAPNTGNWPW